jgi:hypothetical protein
MPVEEHEVFLLLGRMDGKIDAVMNLQTGNATRIDNLEHRVSKVETDVAGISASGQSNNLWMTNLIAGAAAIAAVLSVLATLYLGAAS